MLYAAAKFAIYHMEQFINPDRRFQAAKIFHNKFLQQMIRLKNVSQETCFL